MPLTPEHRAWLAAHAVDPDLAERLGVRSVVEAEDLPEDLRWAAEKAGLPGISFPWRSAEGRVVEQYRPDEPLDPETKYVQQTGPGVLWRVNDAPDAQKVLIVEGTKGCLAAASCLDATVQVLGVGGCSNWSSDGIPDDDLELVEGRDTVVLFDADLTTNKNVHDAAEALGRALKAEGVKSVRYAAVPARGSNGLDDYLAKKKPGRRRSILERIIRDADKLPPKPRAASGQRDLDIPADRPALYVDGEALKVVNRALGRLRDRFDGTRLFCYGDVIALVDGSGTTTPLTDAGLHLEIAGVWTMVRSTRQGDVYATMPPDKLAMALCQADTFVPLERISRTPFVREDGSIRQAAGYDRASRTLLLVDPELGEVEVPESPTGRDIGDAVDLLCDEWLGDFPFEGEADRANVLALVLTPFIRGLVPLAPMAVVDGLQAGVGKNLLMTCVSLVVRGVPIDPLPWPDEDAEIRKGITAAFRAGKDLFVFDEAHELRSSSLARALTAETWEDRLLGHTRMLHYPNRVTWAALGNNVRVVGDMFRRVYPVRLQPAGADPHLRTGWRHDDLPEWTRENRGRLLSACLVLVRAWHVAGRPYQGVTDFGSFERWQRVVGGILQVVGVPGFLGNRVRWSSDSDPEKAAWRSHLSDLHDHASSPDTAVTAGWVADAIRSRTVTHLPIGVLAEAATANGLGMVYRHRVDQWEKEYVLRKGAPTRQKASTWWVEEAGKPNPEGAGSAESAGLAPTPTYRVSQNPPSSLVHIYGVRVDLRHTPQVRHPDNVVFDLETGSVADLWTAGPEYVTCVGHLNGSGEAVTHRNPSAIPRSGPLVAHNGFQFDFHVLARHYGLDLLAESEAGRLVDTKVLAALADPPPVWMKPAQVERHYSLDAVASRLGLPGKTDDIRRLARKHGGYLNIPYDILAPYCRGDVEATAALLDRLPITDYARREMRLLGRLAASVTGVGFRVDVALARRRFEDGQRLIRDRLDWLVARYDLPTTRKDGSLSSAPHRTELGKAAIFDAFYDLGADPHQWPPELCTAKGKPSLGREAMETLATSSSAPPAVVELARTVLEMNGVRTVYQTVLENLAGDRVHPTISARQASGRLSITGPGLTVMGKRDGRHVERAVFLPDEGEVLLAFDLDQIDARAVAALCQDPAYVALFTDPSVDSHEEIAFRLWGVRDGKKGVLRNRAKAIGHGWTYGEGLRRIASSTGIPLAEVERFDAGMRQSFPVLVKWQNEVRDAASTGGLLDNGFGRMMRPDPARAHTQGPALMGQGLARDLMMQGVLRLPLEVVPMLRAVVHDEIVLSVPRDRVVDVRAAVLGALTFEHLGVPITAGCEGPGCNWGDVYEKREAS